MTAKDDFDDFDDAAPASFEDDNNDTVADLDGGARKPGNAKGKLVLAGASVLVLGVVGFFGLQILGGNSSNTPAAPAATPAPQDTAAATEQTAPVAPPTADAGSDPLAIGNPMAAPSAVSADIGGDPLLPAAIPGGAAPIDGTAPSASIDLAMPPAIVAPGGSSNSIPDISGKAPALAEENIIAPANPALAGDTATDIIPTAPAPAPIDASAAIPLDMGLPTAIPSPAPITDNMIAPAAPDAIAPSLADTMPIAAPVASVPETAPTPTPTVIVPAQVSSTTTTTTTASPELEKRLAKLESLLTTLGSTVATQKDINKLESRLSAVESAPKAASKSSTVSEDTYNYNDEAPKAAPVKKVKPAKKAAAKPVVAKSSTILAAPVTSNWVLKSARPGSAWVAQKGSSELLPVKVGETLPGIGKITSITKASDGRWVVNGTKGRVNQ